MEKEPKDRLRAIRKRTGQTQNEFADSRGINRSTYKTWEQGKYSPKHTECAKIELEFDLPRGHILFGETPQPQPGSTFQETAIPKDLLEEVVTMLDGIYRADRDFFRQKLYWQIKDYLDGIEGH